MNLDRLRNIFRNKEKSGLMKVGAALVGGVLLLVLANWLRGGDNGDIITPENKTLSSLSSQTDIAEELAQSNEDFTTALEKRLETALAQIDGAGNVKVLLTLAHGREIIVAEDTTTNEDLTEETDSEGGSRKTQSSSAEERKILITNSDGVSVPLILREVPPVIEGVVIIAEGGDNIFVQDALTRAAETVLGLSVDKVQVFKMKS